MFILHFIVNQKISPVAALPINPKRSTLMKANFQERISSYLPTSSVTNFLFADAVSKLC